MKSVSSALGTHLQQGQTTLAYLWKVKRAGDFPEIVQSGFYSNASPSGIESITPIGPVTLGNLLLVFMRINWSGSGGSGAVNVSDAFGNAWSVLETGDGRKVAYTFTVAGGLDTFDLHVTAPGGGSATNLEAYVLEISNAGTPTLATSDTGDSGTLSGSADGLSISLALEASDNWMLDFVAVPPPLLPQPLMLFACLNTGEQGFVQSGSGREEDPPGWIYAVPSADPAVAGNSTVSQYSEMVYQFAGTPATLGFTNHDQAITFGPDEDGDTITYEAFAGFTNTAQAGKSDLSVDNAEVTAFLESDYLDDADLRAGLYDDALIEIRIVNWADLTMGDMLVRTGTLGQVKMKNGLATAEIRGLSYKLTANIGSLYGPICRAQFGSGKNGIDTNSQWLCQIDVTLYQQDGTISSSADAETIVPSSGLLQVGSATPTDPAPSGWFDDGLIFFKTGVLSGYQFEIKTWDGTTLALYLPMPQQPSPGDEFVIEVGCDHTIFDCNEKFNNTINARLEDFIPGPDVLLDYPSA
ncbi:MAG: DUF2163 domain-containing protein [Candidatus Acidiferrales bacterium]